MMRRYRLVLVSKHAKHSRMGVPENTAPRVRVERLRAPLVVAGDCFVHRDYRLV